MKQIYPGESKIEGRGLFIGENAKRGEVISQIKGVMKFKVNKTKKDATDHPDWVGVAKNEWIDPARPYKFINHSCNPSVGIQRRTQLVALRPMKAGDEITLDYSTIEGDPNWEMKCLCGEKNCRKTISSVHSLPKKQFAKYLPYVSTYFKNMYLKEHKELLA